MGDLSITLDRDPGEDNQSCYQELQRMLYLEEWDCFAPASCKGAQPICYYCRKSGHVKKDCAALQSLTCFQCGNQGHIRRNCREAEFQQDQPRREELDQYTQKRDDFFEPNTLRVSPLLSSTPIEIVPQ